MWTTTNIHKHEANKDSVIELLHDFGNNVQIVTNLENKTTKLLHGGIQVGDEYPLIQDTDKYLTHLNNIDQEVNPII